jgi:NmrA-like family
MEIARRSPWPRAPVKGVSRFWAPGQGEREDEIGAGAVNAARSAGVKHLIWSTLPDVKKISGGRFKVEHFTKTPFRSGRART